MSAEKKTVNGVGRKMIRACDSCIRKRARWYCATDDAFLCQLCDASVHRTNQLGDQHKRVLLRTASSKLFGSSEPEPSWHQGFTRRARTPRKRSKNSLQVEGKNNLVSSLVPEIGSLEASLLDDGEDEEQLLYCVPVFDPFETEICNESNEIDRSLMTLIVDNKLENPFHLDNLCDFGHPTDDLQLLEFGVDLGFDDTSCTIEDLGLTNNYKEEDNYKNIGFSNEENRVEVEDKEVEAILGLEFVATRETLDWNFEFDNKSSVMVKEEENKLVVGIDREHMMLELSDQSNEGKMRTSSIVLRLNYEDVINTWADQGSPWANGTRPQLDYDDYFYDFMGPQQAANNTPSYESIRGSDGGREARVLRYREKRRSRLFSKKIRYEVRKLNAEKRPRMKGRFVKREALEKPNSTSSFPALLIKN